jgi:hypothetical protein
MNTQTTTMPNFVDTTHERPVMTASGEGQALTLLMVLLSGIITLTWMLAYLP